MLQFFLFFQAFCQSPNRISQVSRMMSTETFIRKPAQLFSLVLILVLCLWRSLDGACPKRRAHRTNFRGLFCENQRFACLDIDGSYLGFICMEFWAKWNFRCETDKTHDQLLAICRKKYPNTDGTIKMILKCTDVTD